MDRSRPPSSPDLGTNGAEPVPPDDSRLLAGERNGYGYGGYGGYGTIGAQRTAEDYLQILRERVWYVVIGFLVVLTATAVYTLSRTPVYGATATVQIFRRSATVLQVQQVTDNEVRSAEDVNTQVNLLKSEAIVQLVAARLAGDERARFLAPYTKAGASEPPDILKVLREHREIVPQRLSLIVAIEYRHPDKQIAARVADLFADEYISYVARTRVDDSLKAVGELEQRATEQRKKVDEIAKSIQAYREKNNLVSLDQRKDIVTEKLKELSGFVTQNSAALQDAETRWSQVQTAKARGEDLLNLSFIASVKIVGELQQEVAKLRITAAQLSQRYKPRHPKMAEALHSLEEGERQLQRAVANTTAQVEANYHNAQQNLEQARAALAAQEADSLSLDRYAVDYANLEREFEVNERLLQHLLARMQETSMTSSIEKQNARLVDRAVVSRKPVSPKYLVNFALGIFGGLAVGVGLAFFVATVDDRIKSSYDIESVIGLPLLSVIPKFDKKDKAARDPDPADDPEIAEAFSTLYSSLRLKDSTSPAQCLAVTSTVPSEGKSLIARNLALTMASHGERVLLIDCDLRRPTLHRALKLDNKRGMIDVCTQGATLDSVVIKNFEPNLDVVPTGGRAKNPAQSLTNRNLETFLTDARAKYDRILIDTPPAALVSDVFIILPMTDGAIYSIFFNKVRRKAADFCVQRLREIDVPHLGAVLNGLDRDIGGYYYHQYYDKSYKNYYVQAEKDDDPNEPARR